MRAKAIFRLAGLAGALALLLAGCKADARSADELGDVTSNDEGGPDVRLAALRSQARDLEGDALIDLKGSQEEGDVRQGTLSATVVHFTDPTCTEAQ
jgi:hypothetical protein